MDRSDKLRQTMKYLFSSKHLFTLLLFVSLFLGVARAQTIVTSIHPYFSLTEQIAPQADVHRLLAIGTSPHSFEPKPSQIRTVANADLIIINGVIDAWVYDIIEASKSQAIVLDIMNELDFQHIDSHDGHDHSTHSEKNEEERDLGNPHIWLNPVLMSEAVQVIAEHITALDTLDSSTVQANANKLSTSIRNLDRQIQRRLIPITNESFVPFHNAWAHFADHYHLNLLLEIEPAPGREPTAHYLAEALQSIEETNTKAVFSEVQLAKRPAQVVADNAKVELFQLDPIGGSEGRESYQKMLLYNVNTLIEALR